jgi:hypothetical protein
MPLAAIPAIIPAMIGAVTAIAGTAYSMSKGSSSSQPQTPAIPSSYNQPGTTSPAAGGTGRGAESSGTEAVPAAFTSGLGIGSGLGQSTQQAAVSGSSIPDVLRS